MASTLGLFSRGVGITDAGTLGLFGRGIGTAITAVVASYTGIYARQHASALAKVKAAGGVQLLTFTADTPGTYDAATGSFTGATSGSVTGYAIRRQPSQADLERFRARGLSEDKVVLLFFVAVTYGDEAVLGARVTWDSEVMTVRDMKPFAPDGWHITNTIAVSR